MTGRSRARSLRVCITAVTVALAAALTLPATAGTVGPGLPYPPIAPTVRPVVIEVTRGDTLWSIASETLAETTGGLDRDRYWRLVIEANRSTLRSGDPDMIYPGEQITLPPIPGN